MDLVSVSDAASRLDVSVRQIQNLVASGDLCQVARGVVDRASVERLSAVRAGSHVRPWSESTAWGAIALLSGRNVPWLGSSQRSRLRARLRQISATQLIERARRRADVRWYAGHPASVTRVRAELVDTSDASSALGLAGSTAVDGYLERAALDDVVARHALVADPSGRFVLRSTSMPLEVVADLARSGHVLAAFDLGGSMDVRERRAGQQGIDRALEAFRD